MIDIRIIALYAR